MSSKTASARPGHDRTSLYDEITGKIIAELETGRVPWVQPWGTAAAKAPLAMPKNAATGRHYSGINVLILWGAVIEHGFPAQSWLTFRQALSLGGNVRKGEHGTTVVPASEPSALSSAVRQLSRNKNGVIARLDRATQGGFNRSSQHFSKGGCDEAAQSSGSVCNSAITKAASRGAAREL